MVAMNKRFAIGFVVLFVCLFLIYRLHKKPLSIESFRPKSVAEFPIEYADFIWLYVEMNDEFVEQMKPYKDTSNIRTERFSTIDELVYSFRSYRKHCSWHKGRVILVTCCNQIPARIDDTKVVRWKSVRDNYDESSMRQNKDQILWMDHTDFIPSCYLPTFNSVTIETCLWRIPYITPIFVEWNDDMFAIKDTRPEDFKKDGLVQNIHNGIYSSCILRQAMHTHLVCNALDRSPNYIRYFKDHTPWVIVTEVLRSICTEYPDVYENNLRHKFRDTSQVCVLSMAVYYMNHLEIAEFEQSSTALGADTGALFRDFEDVDFDDLNCRIRSKAYKWLCLNNFAFTSKERVDTYQSLLDNTFPEPSVYES